jgi:predicted ester cyclase
MPVEENKAIVCRFFEAFEADDHDALRAVLAPDMTAHLPGDSEPMDRDAFLGIVHGWSEAFSDLRFSVESQIAEGDTVANRVTIRGVHDRGRFFDREPTGKALAITVLTTERIKDGVIIERWVVFDLLDLARQLGAAA